MFDTADLALAGPADTTASERTPSRLLWARPSWARLLARVFSIDITVCRRCGGKLRVIAAITDADEIARLLRGARPPPRPEPHGQQLLFL
jgi:hypothetical protein